MSEPAVRFDRVSKRFRLGESHASLADLLVAGAAHLFHRRRRSRADRNFRALHEVSFVCPRGEALGIIGPNGAGKSTALKLLAGILRPDAGRIHVDGRLAALIEVGAGFHGDLTGRENVFLNGAILGMTRREIRAKLDDIVAFAGLERFLDTPVKRYSSGMYARLGFSIAAHVDPDVLLVDEVLSVGDAVFRLRCMERMRQLIDSGAALVFVTHNLDQMQSICRRALVLNKGTSAFTGDARDAVAVYLRAMTESFAERPTDLPGPGGESAHLIDVTDLRTLDDQGRELVWAHASEPLSVEITLCARAPVARAVIELNLRGGPSENVLSVNSARSGVTFDTSPGEHRAVLRLEPLRLRGGEYFWNVRVWDADRGRTLLDTPFRWPLVIDDAGRATGSICAEHEWTWVSHRSLSSGTVCSNSPRATVSSPEPNPAEATS